MQVINTHTHSTPYVQFGLFGKVNVSRRWATEHAGEYLPVTGGLRLLFLQAHPGDRDAHFPVAGMLWQSNQSDSFCIKHAAFYQSLKSKVGLAAKPATLMINLNVEGCVIEGRRSFLGPRWVIGGSPIFGSHQWVPAEN
jgi:hypothetical protein